MHLKIAKEDVKNPPHILTVNSCMKEKQWHDGSTIYWKEFNQGLTFAFLSHIKQLICATAHDKPTMTRKSRISLLQFLEHKISVIQEKERFRAPCAHASLIL